MATTARAGLLSAVVSIRVREVENPARTWPEALSCALIRASAAAAADSGALTASSRPKSPELRASERSRARPRTASAGSGEASERLQVGKDCGGPAVGRGGRRAASRPSDGAAGLLQPTALPACTGALVAGPNPGNSPATASGAGPPPASSQVPASRTAAARASGSARRAGDRRNPRWSPAFRDSAWAPARAGLHGLACQQLGDDRGVRGDREVHRLRRSAAIDRGGQLGGRGALAGGPRRARPPARLASAGGTPGTRSGSGGRRGTRDRRPGPSGNTSRGPPANKRRARAGGPPGRHPPGPDRGSPRCPRRRPIRRRPPSGPHPHRPAAVSRGP